MKAEAGSSVHSFFVAAAFALALAGCGGSGSSGSGSGSGSGTSGVPGAAGDSVGGSVSGLVGTVVLQNNGGDNLTVAANGNFAFATKIANGNTYNVTILTQPAGQTCRVSNGSGLVSGNISSVAVVCSASSGPSSGTYSVGGSVSGLVGTVVLQNNGGDSLTVAANGNFTFATKIVDGNTYNVAILTQPAGQTCTVTTGFGTISGNNVTNVAVVCSTNTYRVWGVVSGLSGSLVLQNNNGDNLTLTSSGSFSFPSQLANGSPYSVTVLTQPARQSCSVANGTGTISGFNITNVTVTCVTTSLPITQQILAVSPSTVTAGGPPFVITVLGTGYTITSKLQWNGAARTTTYVSPTELTAQIAAADIASAGTADVMVTDSSGVSPAVQVAIASPSKDAVAFQLNAAHSGVIDFNAVSLPAASTWNVNLGGAPSYALIAAGKVFVTVDVSGNTQLVALDQTTGATVWGPIAISGAANAAYDSGTVFVHSGVIGQGLMQAYDAATGQLKWSTLLTGQSSFTSPPTAANGFVYTAGSGSGGTLYAVRQSDGVITWTQPVVNGGPSAPAVSADSVYVTYPCQTYSFRPITGESLWRDNTGCSGGGGAAPVVANGVLYAPNGTGVSYNGSTFNAETGALLGSYLADNPPAIGSQNGYFLQSKILRGISLASNTALWSFAGDGLLVTSPIVVNSGASSYVFVGSSSGNLYAVDATTGSQLWTVNVGAAIPSGAGEGANMQISALSAGDGLLVVPAGNTLTAYTLSISP